MPCNSYFDQNFELVIYFELKLRIIINFGLKLRIRTLFDLLFEYQWDLLQIR